MPRESRTLGHASLQPSTVDQSAHLRCDSRFRGRPTLLDQWSAVSRLCAGHQSEVVGDGVVRLVHPLPVRRDARFVALELHHQ